MRTSGFEIQSDGNDTHTHTQTQTQTIVSCSAVNIISALPLDSSEGQTCKGSFPFTTATPRPALGPPRFYVRGTEGTVLEDKGKRSLKLSTHLQRGRLQGVMNRHSPFTYFLYLHLRPRVSCVNAIKDLKSKACLKSSYVYLKQKEV